MGLTKDRERREARDQTKDVGVSADARLTKQRDDVLEQRKAMIAANRGAVRDLRESHESLQDLAKKRVVSGQNPEVDLKRLEEVRDRQVTALQESRKNKATDLAEAVASVEALRRGQDEQRTRLEASAARPGADLSELARARAATDEHHAQQEQRANALLAELRGALARREMTQRLAQQAERDNAAAIVRSPAADQERDKQYAAARDAAERDGREKLKAPNAEIANLKQQLDAIRYRIDAETMSRLRERIDPSLSTALRDTNNKEAKLSIDAYQRIAAILLAERLRSRASTTDSANRERAAIEHAKAQLLEEIVIALRKSEIEAEGSGRRVIDGDAIRTDDQKKLSDGMVVKDGVDGHLRLDEAWEVKAGPEAARELSRRIEDVTSEDRDQAMALAIELTLERLWEEETGQRVVGADPAAVEARLNARTGAEQAARDAWEQNLTYGQLANAVVEARVEFERLMTRAARTEAGQPDQLRERVRASSENQQTRFFENGKSKTVDNDRDIKIRTAVPSDVHERMAEAQRNEARRIQIESTQLRELVEAMKKQLQDDRYW